MKVIEPGVTGDDWRMTVRCTGSFLGARATNHGCDALLQLEWGDLLCLYRHDDEQKERPRAGFECCECHAFTAIPSSALPCGPQALPEMWPELRR